MKRKLKMAAGILVFVFCILSGCQRKGQEDLLLPVFENGLEEQAPGLSGDNGQEASGDGAETKAVEESDQNAGSAGFAETDKGQSVLENKDLVVHICGAVSRPGVYTMNAGSRIYQAVERAGGFGQDAARDYLNQADLLADGMKIYVPTNAEVEALGEEDGWKNLNGMQKEDSGTNLQEGSLLVNINTAGEELLCTLPGVGSSKAKSIIAYREKNGLYRKIEDIMKVEGIKDGLFNKIKDSITVH